MSEPVKVALITGGARGIGLGIARCLAAEGWHLAINGVRGETDVAAVLTDLQSSGVPAFYCRGDVASGADREQIVRSVRDRFGRIDLLVNNAGIRRWRTG
jgi:NAD(P)-dependent dehydrogenase (short-subunit alcohol dehydrogenase family)